jgi:hypothetical protein
MRARELNHLWWNLVISNAGRDPAVLASRGMPCACPYQCIDPG